MSQEGIIFFADLFPKFPYNEYLIEEKKVCGTSRASTVQPLQGGPLPPGHYCLRGAVQDFPLGSPTPLGRPGALHLAPTLPTPTPAIVFRAECEVLTSKPKSILTRDFNLDDDIIITHV